MYVTPTTARQYLSVPVTSTDYTHWGECCCWAKVWSHAFTNPFMYQEHWFLACCCLLWRVMYLIHLKGTLIKSRCTIEDLEKSTPSHNPHMVCWWDIFSMIFDCTFLLHERHQNGQRLSYLHDVCLPMTLLAEHPSPPGPVPESTNDQHHQDRKTDDARENRHHHHPRRHCQ